MLDQAVEAKWQQKTYFDFLISQYVFTITAIIYRF